MKTVAILLGYEDVNRTKPLYKDSSILLQKVFMKYGIRLIKVSYKNMTTKGVFLSYCFFDEKGDTINIEKPVKPDVLRQRINKGNLYIKNNVRNNYMVVPEFDVVSMAADKYETYLCLKEFMPKSALLHDIIEHKKIRDALGNKLVMKPLGGNGGTGILFVDKESLLKKVKKFDGLGKSYIVQEFIDFSKGYKSLISGNHDLRLAYVGNKLSFCIIRHPKKGSLKSNIASGGSQECLKKAEIPREVKNLATKIKKKMKISQYNIYSLDFGYCKKEKKWYLIEINYSPGTWFPKEDEKYQMSFFNDLALFFNEIINERREKE